MGLDGPDPGLRKCSFSVLGRFASAPGSTPCGQLARESTNDDGLGLRSDVISHAAGVQDGYRARREGLPLLASGVR
jgi:hypothetical protein